MSAKCPPKVQYKFCKSLQEDYPTKKSRILFKIAKQTSQNTYQAVKSQAPGRRAHQRGWSGMVCTPLCWKRNDRSCNLGSTAEMFCPGPVQKSSADDAARGHEMGSMFEGPDCSVHSKCWPGYGQVSETTLSFKHRCNYLQERAWLDLRSGSRQDQTSRPSARS